METKNKNMIFLGVVLLAIGLVAAFYYESKTIFGIEYMRTYPYQNVGIALIVVGVMLIAGGFLYQPQKEPSQLPQQQPS